jgi:starch phosphorylase
MEQKTMDTLQPFLKHTSIAYFSMEIALRPEMRTYSGGLGILAGDCARSCADLGLPLVLVTLVSHEGYLRQEIGSSGEQIDHPDPWRVEDWATPLDSMVAVDIEGRSVWVRPWLYVVSGPLGGRIPVLLLDTRLEQNCPEDRSITDRLYGGDAAYRLKQEIVLGVGGARILEGLGFEIRKFHLNEGHASLLTLHLLVRQAGSGVPLKVRLENVRDACVFTTHTPVEAGHDRFSYDEVSRILGQGSLIDPDLLKELSGENELNMTHLALNLSRHVNGVAEAHAETTRRMFPGYQVGAITNGVHVPTWTHPSFAELFQGVLSSWAHQPERLTRCEQLSDEAVWGAHRRAKSDFVAAVEKTTGKALDEERPIIAFARRMTGYKRPNLIFSDPDRLREINRRYPFQIVVGGKAHPQDQEGKALIAEIHRHILELAPEVPIAFVPNYDMELARLFVSGADVWLNTPMPPREASGTSGMKAALNGVLNFGVLDGWWIEGCVEGVTGWAIGEQNMPATEHASDCLDKLERTVLPLFYNDRPHWIWMMKQSISKIGSYFNSQRMMRRYGSEVYLS